MKTSILPTTGKGKNLVSFSCFSSVFTFLVFSSCTARAGEAVQPEPGVQNPESNEAVPSFTIDRPPNLELQPLDTSSSNSEQRIEKFRSSEVQKNPEQKIQKFGSSEVQNVKQSDSKARPKDVDTSRSNKPKQETTKLPRVANNTQLVQVTEKDKQIQPSPPLPLLPLSPSPSSPPPPLSPSPPPLSPAPNLNEVRILTPQTGMVETKTTNLVVEYSTGAQIQVTVNNKPLNTKEIQTQIEPSGGNTVTQVWYSIPLEKGKNAIAVQAGNGTPVKIELNYQEAAPSAKIIISPANAATVQADGRSTIALDGTLTSETGEPVREETVVTLTSSAGKFVGADYDKDQPGFQVLAKDGKFTALLQSSLQAQKVRIRAAVERRVVKDPSRRVVREGYTAPTSLPPTATITESQVPETPQNVGIPPNSNNPLPTTNSDVANPLTPDIEAYTQVEFVTFLRPPITTGVVNLRIGARGTDFFGPRANFLNPDRIGKGANFDVNAAVFSTGKVGEWLFTGAYNSQRNLNQTCDYTTQLFRGPQTCEQTYPVYGDSSTVDYLTPSKDSVYLRFERTSKTPGAEPDYGMWGDYNTTEFARASQLYSATNRQLHGFKANYSFGNLQITGAYSRDIDGFERDTLVPNGTSGYYFLSKRLIVPGSENVFLESEEINRPGTVLERKPLYRGPDYEIDYDRGTLLFRRPMLATELNPFGASMVRRIVTTYQYESAGGGKNSLYAGRAQYNFSQGLNQRNSWLGASYLREGQGRQDFELYGADLLVPLGKEGQLIAEYAHSSNNSIFLGNVRGSAYRIEAYGAIAPWLQARGYYRSLDAGFANNATTSFTPGQTRYGAQFAAALTRTTKFTASFDHEENFGIAPAQRTEFFDVFNPRPDPIPGSRVNNLLNEVRAGVVQKVGAADLSLEYVNRSRIDRAATGLSGAASQLVSRLSVPITSTVAFRAQNELNFNRSDPLYPNRTTFGVDWAAFPGLTLRLAHQFANTRVFDRDSITSLDTIMERKLGENTSITGRYSLLNAYNSITGQGAVGLNHRIILAPGLRMNVGYEHIFNNLFARTGAGEQFAQPYATGQSASALGIQGGNAYSVGVEYTDNPNFQASARVEYRSGGRGASNLVISGGGAGKITPALTGLLRFDQANSSNQLLVGLGNTSTIKLGLAYRDPANDQFNALMRYEYRKNPATIPETLLLGSGTGSEEHLLAAETIYAPNWRWEFYGKYALRYSTTYLASDFTNTSMVYLGQLRTTYRLGYRMDLAGEVRLIGQPSAGYQEIGFAIETGYYLTPDLRVSVGYSLGRVNDRDFTGYRSDGGPYLGVTLKVNELFSGFGRQTVSPPQQRESATERGRGGERERGRRGEGERGGEKETTQSSVPNSRSADGGSQFPISNSRYLNSDSQSPITNYQLPITNPQLPVSEFQLREKHVNNGVAEE